MTSTDRIGEVVGQKYRLDAVLGEGGFGLVYRGTTHDTGRIVAVKVLKRREDGLSGPVDTRFRRELRAIARLESPYSVTLYDYGATDDGALFMVTEYVDGEDLADLLLRRGRLTEAEATHILIQILSSLDEAHQKGILHRDIKPGNIRIFTRNDDPLCVKVLDFGIARILDDDSPSLTKSGIVLGTPRYLAPELLLGAPPSPASDLFSVGLVARDLMLGTSATEGRHFLRKPTELLFAESDPVSAGFRSAVNRLLAYDAASRFSSAAEAIEALRGSTNAAPPTAVWRPPPTPPLAEVDDPTRPHRVAPAPAPPPAAWWQRPSGWWIALVTAAVTVGVALLAHSAGDPPPPPPTELPPEILRAADPEPVVPTAPVVVEPPDPCLRSPGLRSRSLDVARWVEHVPQQLPDNPPLVVLLRPKDTSSHEFLVLSGFQKLADGAGFIVIAPDDSDDLFTNPWADPSDNARIVDIVDHTKKRLCAGPVYLVGHAAGAVPAHALACEDWVTAVAISGTRTWTAPALCRDHAPAIWLDPRKSPRLPWDGGEACPGQLMGAFATDKLSHDEVLGIWLAKMGCRGEARGAFQHENGACSEWECDRPFQACVLDGGDGWPNLPPTGASCDSVGADFPAAQAVWNFFVSIEPGSRSAPRPENERPSPADTPPPR